MGRIVAIGGGEFRELETLPIDRRVVELTGKSKPRALFIGSASSDSPDYAEAFRQVYGGQLGCETEVLALITRPPSQAEIEQKILSSDLIYVGGGNTLKMMRRWRHLGVDKLLEDAYRRDIVLSGVSAGAICWFTGGHSDSMSFYSPERWQYIYVRSLGLVDALFCPHLDGENRLPHFKTFIAKRAGVGIGVDDNCALEIVDGGYRVITSKGGAKAYKLYRQRGEIMMREIEQAPTHRPLADLLAKA